MNCYFHSESNVWVFLAIFGADYDQQRKLVYETVNHLMRNGSQVERWNLQQNFKFTKLSTRCHRPVHLLISEIGWNFV
jgi:hypothetical protein